MEMYRRKKVGNDNRFNPLKSESTFLGEEQVEYMLRASSILEKNQHDSTILRNNHLSSVISWEKKDQPDI